MLCQLSHKAKSVRVCGISELSLVPSIPMCSIRYQCKSATITLTSVNGQTFASCRIRTLNRRYLGSPINWTIACWEIRLPMNEELDKRPFMKSTAITLNFVLLLSF